MSQIVKEIDVAGEWYEVCVVYEIIGKYYPATRNSPAEYPEAEWTLERAIDAEGNEVTDRDTLRAIEDELDRLNIAAECETDAAENAEHDRGEYLWEQGR